MPGHQARLLDDGRRLHLHWGPIDLIIEAFGGAEEVRAAYAQAEAAFAPILPELVGELPVLRSADRTAWKALEGPVARQMARAAMAYDGFVTPMAGVAGAVADQVRDAMVTGRNLKRAYVNNGGDCALFLRPAEVLDLAAPAGGGGAKIRISGMSNVRGIATSGWRGRSWSLGIADAVTVLAKSAVQADVAATMIANEVRLPAHPAVTTRRADDLDPDSDLGDRLVTTGVGALSAQERERALAGGVQYAEELLAQGRIVAAFVSLQGQFRQVVAGATSVSDSITLLME